MTIKIVRLSLVLGLVGCVTPGGNSTRTSEKPKMIEKNQDKTVEVQPDQNTNRTSETPPLKPATNAEMIAFVRNHRDPSASFGSGEHEFVERIPRDSAGGMVAEAALVIGVVKRTLYPVHQSRETFETHDLSAQGNEGEQESAYATPAGNQGTGPSIEREFESLEINLPDALSENPLLESPAIARMVLESMRVGPNSESFVKEVMNAIGARVADWEGLSRYMGRSMESMTAIEPETPAQPAYDDNVPLNPADLRSGDSLLMEAQRLAEKGNFKLAIQRILAVKESSPMFKAAQEKVREFSNRAVQDLRRKAARAFQSAVPVTDIETRSQYLKEAKMYLEQAIQEYPHATQLPTVRENLRVISRDLERLESEQG